MSISVGDLQCVEYLPKLGTYFKFKDILVGGMGNVNKYFVDFKKRINKFYTLIKKLPCQSHLCRKWGADQ